MNPVLVRGARQLLTLRGATGPKRGEALSDLGVVENGSVLIREGKVVQVGATRRVENLAEARNADEIDATGRVVMPAFIDSLAHPVMAPPLLDEYERNLAVASPLRPRIHAAVQQTRATGRRPLTAYAQQTLDRMRRHGTLTAEARSGFGLDTAIESRLLQIAGEMAETGFDVAPAFFGAQTTPPEYEGKPDHYIDWLIMEMLPSVRRRKLARLAVVAIGEHAFTAAQARRFINSARSWGYDVKVEARGSASSAGALLAVEMGAITADYLDCATEADADLIASSWAVAVLAPATMLMSGQERQAPARSLIRAGAAVALASGFGPVSSPVYNMQTVLSLACSQLRMTPAEAISAATVNAAWALGLGDRAGSIEADRKADLLIIDAPDYREMAYYGGANLVHRVIQHGKVVA